MVTPRTRDNRLDRQRGDWKRHTANVGKDSMENTCPRCGWPCTHLVHAYFDSPWNEHGGICTQCCHEANLRFDVVGWPDDPHLQLQIEADAQPQVEEPPELFN